MEQTQLTALPPFRSFISDWRPPSPSPPFGSEDWIEIPTVPSLARYATFKYRVLITWYLMEIYGGGKWLPLLRRSWLAMIEGADADKEDLWLWEDEDEESIKALRPHLTLQSQSLYSLRLFERDWVDACRALESRTGKPRTIAQKVLARLSPHTRVRIIAWGIVAGPLRRSKLADPVQSPNLARLIGLWGRAFHSYGAETSVCTCQRCQSHGFAVANAWRAKLFMLQDVENRNCPLKKILWCFIFSSS
ncbi:hypothetical protein C8R44DRAFT_443982 [Mycena epipterygia]|nr:hypothetical protein C8R44DRAFT_443982 [Mycena epipterygia]